MSLRGTANSLALRLTLLLMTLLARPAICSQAVPDVALPSDVLTLGYRWDVWGTREGLPSSAVQAVFQTDDGYLWIGAQDGLVRFDGNRFTVFDKRNITGISQLSVNALFEGPDGTLWIGCDGAGLLAMKADQFKVYTTAAGLPSNTVNAVLEDRQGNIWVATTRGLSRLADGKFTTYGTGQGLPDDWVETLYEDHQGTLWAGTVHGLARIDRGVVTPVRTGQGLHRLEVDSIAENAAGLWLGTNQGLLLQHDGKLESYSGKMGSYSGRIRSLYEDRAGDLWVGTGGNGLFKQEGDVFRQYTNGGSLAGMTVQGIFEDRDGSLWIGSWGNGLIRLSEQKFKTFGPNLNTALQSRDGSIWGGTNGEGLVRIKDGKTTVYTTRQGLSSNLILSLWEGSSGDLWIGTDSGGLDRFHKGKFTVYGPKQGLVPSSINCIYEDWQGILWLGTTAHGLQSLDGGKFTTYPLSGAVLGPLRSIFEDRDHILWVGADNGLVRSTDKTHSSFELVGGFAKDGAMCIYQDSDGVLWIGTDGSGLKSLHNGRITAYTTADGLFNDVIWSIVEDSGTFWLTSENGIAQVRKSDLDDFVAGRVHSIRSVAYGTADGLETAEFNGGMQPSGTRTADGRLLFTGTKGFVLVDPNRLKPRTEAPLVLIEKVTVDQRSFSLTRPAVAPPGRGKLEFEYTAIDLPAPEGLRFKYRLDRFDRDWIDAGTRRTAYYTNIPPGQYQFHVVACNRDGACNSVGASFPLVLKAHVYQTAWFYLLCGVLLCLMALGLHRLRVRQLHAREDELALRVEERTLKLNTEIVERKRAEQALRRASSQLELILNSAGEGICGFALEGAAMFVNPAAARMTGWTIEEMAGRTAHDLFHRNLTDGSAHRQEECPIAAAFRQGAVRDLQEEVFGRKDGTSFPVEYTITPLEEASRLAGAVLTFKDISPRKEAEDALHQRTIELERSNADLEQFAYVASHDLQEPLRMVASFTQLLAARYRRHLDAEADEFIGFAVEGATRMQALIEGLLSFARVKTRARAFEPTDCQAVLSRALRNLSLTLHEAHAEVTSDVLPTVTADESQMELLLQNLVANAVKFRGPTPPRVHVSVLRNCEHWTFSVRDNGIGIDPAYKERIFGMFQRLHQRTAYPGTGIGLAICKKIVERHGGSIWVESREGCGATFCFTLPVTRDDEIDRASPSQGSPVETALKSQAASAV
jgi:PAS domain S-box-containing protein